jgi:hypothetical protein
MNTRAMSIFVLCILILLAAALPGAQAADAANAQPAADSILPTATPSPAPTATATPATPPDFVDLSQAVPTEDAPPIPTYLPMLMRHFRPQAPMVGVALEGFFAAAGWKEALALQPRYVRRYREIAWRDVEPAEGSYRWEVLAGLEEELRTAAANAAAPILNVQMTPEWAQKHKGNACGPVAADKFDAFARFMEQLVQRYGSTTEYSVRYWQIGNEPDVAIGVVPGESVFGCWGDLSDPFYGGGYYGEMLKAVYPRIKAADPNAQVMIGGLLLECDPYTMSVPDTCRNEDRFQSGYFLEGILKAGAGDYFDVMDIHGYGDLRMDLPARMHSQYSWSPGIGGTGLPEKVAFVRRLLAQYGQPNKTIVATELALKCEEPTDDCQEVGAAYIPRVFAEAHELGLEIASYYALITEFKYKGLLLPDLTPKKQYAAFKFMASQLSWVEYVKPVDQYPGISGAEFNRSRLRELWLLWSTDGTEQYLTPPAGFVQVTDKYGNVIDLVDGKIVVDWSPVYVYMKVANEKD